MLGLHWRARKSDGGCAALRRVDFLRPKTIALFFLNANYHILKSAVMQPRVNIRKVHEKSFRMRYYELFWTNFDPYNDHFSLISKTLIK